MTHLQYVTLVNEAKKHSYLYYVESSPIISDAEFDTLLVAICQYEQAHPEHILPDSPTQCVGSDLNGNGRRLVTHRSPMLSQQKAHNIDDIKAFMASVEPVLGYTPSMRIEWKYDGVSCSIVYIDGQLVCAATRGDGLRGQDITEHVKAMPSVPCAISQSGRVEVRGEVVCPKGQHIALGYKDERTAASAILNTSYSDSAKALVFIPWEVIGEYFHTFSDVGKLAVEFPSVVTGYTVNGIQDIEKKIADLSANLLAGYPVDGLVIKIDCYPDFARMGANKHHPKGSIAYKFEAASAVTTVRDIEIKVAKSGRRTPVAHIAPVSLMGKTITKVNMYSENTMLSLGVATGCTVKVALQNDVTPKIIAVVNTDGSGIVSPSPSASAPMVEPIPKRPYMPTPKPEPLMPIDYLDKQNDRIKVDTIRMLNRFAEKQRCESARHSQSQNPSIEQKPITTDSDDAPDIDGGESRAQEQEKGRSGISFKILAAVGAVACVAGLLIAGVGVAAFIAPLLAGAFANHTFINS